MNQNTKDQVLFRYFLKKIVEWYKEKAEVKDELSHPNNLSKMTILKLYFFVCTLDKELFNNSTFYAMRFGPVCSELLDAINQKMLGEYIIDSNGLSINISANQEKTSSNDSTTTDLTSKCEIAIEKLKKINDRLVITPALDLAHLSHSWLCWRNAWGLAEIKKSRAEKMRFQDIEDESIKNYE